MEVYRYFRHHYFKRNTEIEGIQVSLCGAYILLRF